MSILKAYKQLLLLSPEQESSCNAFAGCVRQVYNVALSQRVMAYSLTRSSPTYNVQAGELPELKAAFPYLALAPSQALQQGLKDLQSAFDRFFKGISSFPTPRKKFLNDSFRCPSPTGFKLTRVGKRKGSINLPKLGKVFFRWTQKSIGKPRSATLSKKAGKWYISILCEVEELPCTKELTPFEVRTPIGIDRGCNHTLALSTGELRSLPTNKLKYLGAKIAIWQKHLAKKVKGSFNYKKLKLKISKIHQKLVNIRSDWHHKLSTELAKNHSYIFLEDLDVKKMTASNKGTIEHPGTDVAKKSGLNKAILRQGWGIFETLLTYKTSWYGSKKHSVLAAYSSQDCSRCNFRHPDNRKKEAFECLRCHHISHSDINAAKNIETRGRADLDRLRSKNLRIKEPSYIVSTDKAIVGSPAL